MRERRVFEKYSAFDVLFLRAKCEVRVRDQSVGAVNNTHFA